MAAVKEEEAEEFAAKEVEVAAILCGLKKTLRARERRWRRRMQRLQVEAAPEIPSWGRRRPRSMPEEKQPAAPAPAPTPIQAPGAASPDTPLAYPESGGDDAPAEEEETKKEKPAVSLHDDQSQWVQEQHGVVASLAQENAHLLKQIEEYRARLQSTRSTNESLKHLHKVKREREQEQEEQEQEQEQQQARKAPRLAVPALVLDLNEPARWPEEDEQARAQQAQAAAIAAAAAAAEWYRQVQVRAAMQKAAVSAGARRRRLEILRAKGVCPLVSSRARRVG